MLEWEEEEMYIQVCIVIICREQLAVSIKIFCMNCWCKFSRPKIRDGICVGILKFVQDYNILTYSNLARHFACKIFW